MSKYTLAKDLINFIDGSPSVFHVVENIKDKLISSGFKKLELNEKWSIEPLGRYFLDKNGSAIIAFVVGSEKDKGFKIISSHSDSPCFRVKPNPIMKYEKYAKINTEVYGGPIINTWLDRPLSLAGRVVLKSDDILNPVIKTVDFKKPILIIPNVAIHLNRNINSGIELNKQVDTIPLLGIINDKLNYNNYLVETISSILDVEQEDIIDFELYLYGVEEGCIMGANNEFIYAPKLDDLAMVHSSLNAIIKSKASSYTNVFACFDNEEIGSSTKQGGDSNFLLNTLERIKIGLRCNREGFLSSISDSFMISADLAHAVHPNRGEKHDPILHPVINGGPIIKVAANGSYTTDSFSSSVYESICKKINIPYQKFSNRSDERGGSTLGPISSTHIEMNTIDIGSPVLSMHSIRELSGVDDHEYITESFLEFYNL